MMAFYDRNYKGNKEWFDEVYKHRIHKEVPEEGDSDLRADDSGEAFDIQTEFLYIFWLIIIMVIFKIIAG